MVGVGAGRLCKRRPALQCRETNPTVLPMLPALLRRFTLFLIPFQGHAAVLRGQRLSGVVIYIGGHGAIAFDGQSDSMIAVFAIGTSELANLTCDQIESGAFEGDAAYEEVATGLLIVRLKEDPCFAAYRPIERRYGTIPHIGEFDGERSEEHTSE